jgi:hypothetical protein
MDNPAWRFRMLAPHDVAIGLDVMMLGDVSAMSGSVMTDHRAVPMSRTVVSSVCHDDG